MPTHLRHRLFLAAAALVLPLAARADADFERLLSVSSQPDLYVSSGSGTIRVFPGSEGQIHIKAHLHSGYNFGGGRGDVEDRVRRIAANPPIQQTGNSVHVGETGGELHDLYNNIIIDYEITAPRAVALNLHTGSGDIEVDNLGRFLKATSGSGSVRAHGLAGPADLHTGSGDIELQEHAPGDVRAQTGSGSIRVQGFTGGFDARTGSGDIEGGGTLTGAGSFHTGSGSIRLHLGPQAHFNLQANTGSGTVRIAQQGAPAQSQEDRHSVSGPVNGGGPPLEARTGSGDIEVN